MSDKPQCYICGSSEHDPKRTIDGRWVCWGSLREVAGCARRWAEREAFERAIVFDTFTGAGDKP